MAVVQVDMISVKPRSNRRLPWAEVETMADGTATEVLLPAVAVASLVFHEANWPTLHKRAAPQTNEDGERVYGHPFTCDEAIRAQAVVDGKQPLDGYQDLMVQAHFGTDATDVETKRSMTATHLKVANIAKGIYPMRYLPMEGSLAPPAAMWFKRTSKLLLAIHPSYVPDHDEPADWNTSQKKLLTHRSMTLLVVLMEACARHGIKCTHRYPRRQGGGDVPNICTQCARQVAAVAHLLAVAHRPGRAGHSHRCAQGPARQVCDPLCQRRLHGPLPTARS